MSTHFSQGMMVRDKATKMVGVVERLSSDGNVFVTWKGSKTGWRRPAEIEPVGRNTFNESQAAADKGSPSTKPVLPSRNLKPVLVKPSTNTPPPVSPRSIQIQEAAPPASAAPPAKAPETHLTAAPRKTDRRAARATVRTAEPTNKGGLDPEKLWRIKHEDLVFDYVVGSGKFGEVWLGTYLYTPVAIKKILHNTPETKVSLEREMAMMKGVRHPNIVQFLGMCEHEGDIYLVSEYMEKGDLFDALIFAETPMSWRTKIKVAKDIAQACYYLQAKGILHRDIKSQNILLGENHRAKLCDLGLARALEEETNKRLTFVGTDRWMAPEILLANNYDFKVDVFSFGIVLFEMITGQVPPERMPHTGYKFDAQDFKNKVPQGCPEVFAQLTLDCTAFDPQERTGFKGILETLNLLLEDVQDEPVQGTD